MTKPKVKVRAKTKVKVKAKPKVQAKAKIKIKIKARALKPIKKTKPAKKAKSATRKLSLKRELLLEEKLRSKKQKGVKRPHKVALPELKPKVADKEPNGGELLVGEAKFQLGPKQNAGEFQAHNIPFEYGKNRIVLLIVDPKFVFIYWEVQSDRMHEAVSKIGHNAKLTLRFKNLETNNVWDVSIYERVGNWYLKLDHPEQRLAVDVGMKNDRGDFYSLATSNTMKLPRAGLAPRGPIKWMLVLPTGEKLITEVEEYTDADLELLKKILGPYFFDLLRKGKFSTIVGSSAEHVFTEIEEIRAPSISS